MSVEPLDAGVLATVEPLFERPAHDTARVVLGMTVYNGSRFIAEALDSIFAQEFQDFILVILDDCSTDDSAEVIRRLTASNPKVFAFRNRSRKGMVANWADVFHLGRVIAPQQAYFSWCSDHDVMRPQWLGALVTVLDEQPGVVLGYTVTAPITLEGAAIPKAMNLDKLDQFQAREPDVFTRFLRLHRTGKGFGNMIYGLFRSDALAKVGVFRQIILPDRLVVLELCLAGEVAVVREILRLRRLTSKFSVKRQRTTLFRPGEKKPAHAGLPTWLAHSLALVKLYSGRERRPAGLSLLQLWLLAADLIYWQMRKRSLHTIGLIIKYTYVRRTWKEVRLLATDRGRRQRRWIEFREWLKQPRRRPDEGAPDAARAADRKSAK